MEPEIGGQNEVKELQRERVLIRTKKSRFLSKEGLVEFYALFYLVSL